MVAFNEITYPLMGLLSVIHVFRTRVLEETWYQRHCFNYRKIFQDHEMFRHVSSIFLHDNFLHLLAVLFSLYDFTEHFSLLHYYDLSNIAAIGVMILITDYFISKLMWNSMRDSHFLRQYFRNRYSSGFHRILVGYELYFACLFKSTRTLVSWRAFALLLTGDSMSNASGAVSGCVVLFIVSQMGLRRMTESIWYPILFCVAYLVWNGNQQYVSSRNVPGNFAHLDISRRRTGQQGGNSRTVETRNRRRQDNIED